MASEKCANPKCRSEVWGTLPFCPTHFFEHIQSTGDAAAAELVQRSVMALPERDREILLLRFFHQFPTKQLCDILEISKSACASRIKRALAHFYFSAPAFRIDTFSAPEPVVAEAVRACSAELTAYVAAHPHAINAISSREFEYIVAEILSASGMQVEVTARSKDGGYDVAAFRSDHMGVVTKYIVECKHYAPDRPVGVEIVRALYGIKDMLKAHHAIIATTSTFTKGAWDFVHAPSVWGLHLKDHRALAAWLNEYEKAVHAGGIPLKIPL